MIPPSAAGVTDAQAATLLTGADGVQYGKGVEVLDASLNVVSDISGDLLGGSVSRSMRATVHGTCSLTLASDVNYQTQLLRPYMTITADTTTTTTSTVIDRPAASASRVDDTTAEWAQGTLVNVTAASNKLALTGTPGATYAQTVLGDSPRGYWRLGEASGTTMADASGHTLTGTYSGVTLGQAGALAGDSDTAAKFNGTTSYATLPFILDPSAGSFTIEAWVRFDAIGASQHLIAQTDAGGGTGRALLYYNVSTGLLTSFVDGTAHASTFAPSVDGVAHHIAVVYDAHAATCSFYVDGAAAGSSSTTAPIGSTGGWVIGANKTLNGAFFNGLLDEVAVYPTALSAARVGAHYAAGHTAPATTYPTSGTRVSPALDLSAFAVVDSSTVSWSATAPGGTSVTVETSVNSGATWQTATNGGPITGITPGGSVLTRATLTGNGSATPTLSTLTVSATQNEVSHVVTTESFEPVTAKWYQGAYVPRKPASTYGESLPSNAIDGSDRLYLLNRPVGNAYTVAAGTGVLAAVRQAISDAGLSASTVLLDGTASASTLPIQKVWPLIADTTTTAAPTAADAVTEGASNGTTWLQIVNELLAMVNYRGLWCDWLGLYRSGPYADPATRPVEWTFDYGDALRSIIARGRTVTQDFSTIPNVWIFQQQNTGASYDASPTEPVEGAGQYTVDQHDDPTTPGYRGGLSWPVVIPLDAADQASLVAQGNARVAADRRVTKTLTVTTAPFPAAWHWDVYSYTDEDMGATYKVQSTQWQLDLGANGLPADEQHVWEVIR